ncbi:hypothetical protein EVG20_g4968 [Dentipellis fragilis]|uniref:Restriction endonuclease type IV Mrr domain-containing protein n=1 Tax=Dentipellis fragilis TaxID=205917 RepID=A0A4Y9YUL9_9AGAM|nr:hypothetical protein EVG20_g4968 [Dentipellis fragilis]
MHPTSQLYHLALSNVHRGTAFEQRALHVLQDNMSMALTRVGGRDDGGVDLLGWWWLPDTRAATLDHTETGEERKVGLSTPMRRLRVLAQCKAEKKKLGPAYVREFEGVLSRHSAFNLNTALPMPSMAAPVPTVGVLLSESPFTRASLLAAHSSPAPLALIHLPPSRSASIGTAVWNPALAASNGLLQGEIELRWERSFDGGDAGGDGRPGLWWAGRRRAVFGAAVTMNVARLAGRYFSHPQMNGVHQIDPCGGNLSLLINGLYIITSECFEKAPHLLRNPTLRFIFFTIVPMSFSPSVPRPQEAISRIPLADLGANLVHPFRKAHASEVLQFLVAKLDPPLLGDDAQEVIAHMLLEDVLDLRLAFVAELLADLALYPALDRPRILHRVHVDVVSPVDHHLFLHLPPELLFHRVRLTFEHAEEADVLEIFALLGSEGRQDCELHFVVFVVLVSGLVDVHHD